MKIGIIGAENSHTIEIAKIINIQKLIKGVSVDYVWGETGPAARAAAKNGKIPNIVKDSRQMLGKVDTIVVDHRHPKYHLRAAMPFIEQSIPAFIDKPFCYRTARGRDFLKAARKNKAPVTSFGVVPLQKSFKNFQRKLEGIGDIVAGATYGPCDLKSEYGGVFFYGIHQVEMALHGFGDNVSRVLISNNKNGTTGQLFYTDGKIVTMNLIKEGCGGFSISATGTKKSLHQTITYDKNVYLNGVKTFTKMFKTQQEPFTHEQILKPVKVLEALQKSYKSKKIESV